MHISIHTTSNDASPRMKHVLHFLTHHPFCPAGIRFTMNQSDADIYIYYGISKPDGASKYAVVPQELFFNPLVMKLDDLKMNRFYFKNKHVHSVEKLSREDKPFLKDQIFGFDVFETIFFFISRYEEQFCPPSDQDQWDMMWENNQLLVKSNLQESPIIDHLIRCFFEALGLPHIESILTQRTMTHDIDVLEKYGTTLRTLRASGRAFLDHGFKGLRKAFRTYKNKKSDPIKDPFYTFDFLLIDKAIKIISHKIIFLMAGGETKHDNYYHINSPLAIKIIHEAKEKGYEVGLHPSYNTWRKEKLFGIEKKNLEDVCSTSIKSSRQHFLHFDFSETVSILEKNNIALDSSLGYQRLIGFRCGTGFPFYLYNFKTEQTSSVKELPMIVMDGALLDQNHHNLDQAFEHLSTFIHKNQYDTHLTFNFHNTIFDPTKRDVNKMKQLYKLACACS